MMILQNNEYEFHHDFELLPDETKQMKVINRLNDALFKYVFGRNENKSILINFLNSILEDEGKFIVGLDYLDREMSPRLEGGKACRFDVRARAKDGRIFHVEVQVGSDVNFFERCIFYACDSYYYQLKSGQIYNELMPVIFIGVLGYEEFKGNSVHSRYMLMETESHEIGTDALEFHFFELSKLKHSKDIQERKFYRWLRYLSSSQTSDIKELEGDPMISEALEAEKLFLSNPETRFRYMQAELEKVLSAKREDFFISKGKAEIIKNLAKASMSISQIASAAGMTENEVRKILER